LDSGSGIRRVILTQAVHPRAQDPETLADLVAGHGITPEVVASVQAALQRALNGAQPDDVILATGSLFVVAETSAAARANEPVVD
jgi:dihydrofolate synthase/folylpolyglutamate synthase